MIISGTLFIIFLGIWLGILALATLFFTGVAAIETVGWLVVLVVFFLAITIIAALLMAIDKLRMWSFNAYRKLLRKKSSEDDEDERTAEHT